MPLFEVAFVRVPTLKEQESGIPETLEAGPIAIIGKDGEAAVAAASVKVAKEKNDFNFDSNVKVLVRPFA